MKIKIILLISFISLCIELDEVNLKIPKIDGIHKIYENSLALLKKEASDDKIKKYFKSGNGQITFFFKTFRKENKDSIEKYKKTEGLKTFLDKIFKEWKETEDLKVYLEKEFHYDKPPKDSACEDNCYSFKMYMYGYFLPEENTEKLKLYYVELDLHLKTQTEKYTKRVCKEKYGKQECKDVEFEKAIELKGDEKEAIFNFVHHYLKTNDAILGDVDSAEFIDNSSIEDSINI